MSSSRAMVAMPTAKAAIPSIPSHMKLDNIHWKPDSPLSCGPSSSSSSETQRCGSGAGYITNPSTSPSPSQESASNPIEEKNTEESVVAANHTPATEDPYRDPVQIPGCKPTTFVFPHSSSIIPLQYQDRFRQVVDIFRRNVYEDPLLREYIQYIDYTLKLCGVSSADSHPSILVFCRQSEFKPLSKLLANKELNYQYALRRSAWKYPWKANQTSSSDKFHKPLFNLFFWRHRRPRTLFLGYEIVREAYSPNIPFHSSIPGLRGVPGLMLCGSVIETIVNQPGYSTLGSIIEIGGQLYAITSRHGIVQMAGQKEAESMPPIESRPKQGKALQDISATQTVSGSESDPGDTDSESDDFMMDDITYDSPPEDDADEDHNSEYPEIWTEKASQGPSLLKENLTFIFPEAMDQDETNGLDLDWALVLVPRKPGKWWTSNVSIRLECPKFHSGNPGESPTEETPVLILTSRATPQKGMLQPGFTVLGGINGKLRSEVWSVITLKGYGLSYGDSGSVVIDAVTKNIYGHVIGSNHIGEIYISPYGATIRQIYDLFLGSLPGPAKSSASERVQRDAQMSSSFQQLSRDDRLKTAADDQEMLTVGFPDLISLVNHSNWQTSLISSGQHSRFNSFGKAHILLQDPNHTLESNGFDSTVMRHRKSQHEIDHFQSPPNLPVPTRQSGDPQRHLTIDEIRSLLAPRGSVDITHSDVQHPVTSPAPLTAETLREASRLALARITGSTAGHSTNSSRYSNYSSPSTRSSHYSSSSGIFTDSSGYSSFSNYSANYSAASSRHSGSYLPSTRPSSYASGFSRPSTRRTSITSYTSTPLAGQYPPIPSYTPQSHLSRAPTRYPPSDLNGSSETVIGGGRARSERRRAETETSDDVTIKVTGNAVIGIGGTRINCEDGGEITFNQRPDENSR